jgi:hypothetical protein
MVLTVHNLAENYKCLPTEVMAKATTFDLYVLDTHSRFIKYQEQKAQGKESKQVFASPKKAMPTKAEMQRMWDDVKAMSEERVK